MSTIDLLVDMCLVEANSCLPSTSTVAILEDAAIKTMLEKSCYTACNIAISMLYVNFYDYITKNLAKTSSKLRFPNY